MSRISYLQVLYVNTNFYKQIYKAAVVFCFLGGGSLATLSVLELLDPAATLAATGMLATELEEAQPATGTASHLADKGAKSLRDFIHPRRNAKCVYIRGAAIAAELTSLRHRRVNC